MAFSRRRVTARRRRAWAASGRPWPPHSSMASIWQRDRCGLLMQLSSISASRRRILLRLHPRRPDRRLRQPQTPSFGHHQIHASEKRNGEPAGEGGSGEAEERSDELICEPNGEHAFGAKGETSLTTVAAPQYHSPSAFFLVVSSCRVGKPGPRERFRAHAAFRYR